MGLLRPATPLALILFVAFVLLLLATLSTPIIPAIPLGSWEGVHLGVFGWCNAAGTCSGFQIGYGTEQAFLGNSNTQGFELPVSTRHSLTAILIVHPIAAFLVLICFGLAVAAHFHAPSHSPRYLLGLLILTIPALLVTLLAFLVDILVFVPHVAWGGWIVLAATILIVASSVVTCAMRRTLVSRKARKKRIAENADMNGQNYYENLGRVNQARLMADELPRADSPPPMSGSTAVEMQKQGGVAQFATFETKRQNTHSGDSGDGTTPPATNDDRAPLNPYGMRDPSIHSASTGRGPRPYGAEHAAPMSMGGRMSMDSNGAPHRPSRDQYGNPVSPIGMAAGDPPPGPLRHQGSRGSLGSDRSNGYRGRGGYGPPGRAYGPPRGGYGPPRGGYGPPRGGFRGQGPPPPGWRGRGGPRGGMMPRPGPPPPGYGAPPPDAYYNGSRSPTGMRGTPPPPMAPPHDEFVAGPGPIGQAIEMDERTGNSPARSPVGHSTSPYGLRDSDGDVMGMIGLQQGRDTPPDGRESERSDGIRSPTGVYSDNTYVPPRAGWQRQAPSPNEHDPHSSIPLSSSAGMPPSNTLPLSPIQASPRSHHARGGSDAYYEDVDPRFAVDPGSEAGSAAANRDSGIPDALTPGAQYHQRMPPHPQDPSYLQAPHLPGAQDRSNIPSYVSGSGDEGVSGGGSSGEVAGMETDKDLSSGSLNRDSGNALPTINRAGDNATPPDGALDHAYDTLPAGARSPGEGSEASHFTSISQRPVNPNWRPGYGPAPPGSGPGGAGMSSASAVQRRRDDLVLNANPDFALPGMAPGGRRGGPMRGPRGGAGMGAGSLGLTPGGRYPTDV